MRKVKASCGVLAVTALTLTALMLAPSITMSSRPTESPARVRTVQVETGDVERLIAVSGRVRFTSEYAAISPMTGIVSDVYIRPGDAVTAGQALFRLDGTAQEKAYSASLKSQNSAALLDTVQAVTANQSADWTQVANALQGEQTPSDNAVNVLEQLTVRASTDGLVQQVYVSKHSGVAAGTPVVALSGEKQRILCNVVIRDAAQLRPGLQARILLGGVTACMAEVESIGAATTDTLTGQTVAEVALMPEQNLNLPLGAPVDAEIILEAHGSVPTLPVTAVTGNNTVWWVADGRCWEIPVTVFLQDEVRCHVLLPANISVVDRAAGLTEGQRIKEMKP